MKIQIQILLKRLKKFRNDGKKNLSKKHEIKNLKR